MIPANEARRISEEANTKPDAKAVADFLEITGELIKRAAIKGEKIHRTVVSSWGVGVIKAGSKKLQESGYKVNMDRNMEWLTISWE